MIGLLEIRRRKTQFALIALIVTLISYLVLMINGLGVGLNNAAGSALRNFDADGIAYSERAGLSVIRSELGQDIVDAALNGPGVEEGAPLGYLAVNYYSAEDEVDSAAFLGYDPGTIGEPNVINGDPLTESDEDGVVVDSSFLDASGLKIGDTVTVELRLQTQEFRIVGEIDEGQFFFQPTVYLLRSSWQDLKYSGADENSPVASIVLLKGSGDIFGTHDGYEVVDKSTAFNNIEGVQGQQGTVVALRLFGYIIGTIVIGVFFYVLTLQKIGQIGVMKALGASGFFIFRQSLLQVLTISAIGILISVPAAWITQRGLSELSGDVPIAFNTSTFVTTSIALLIAAAIGALFSARQVAKVDPIIALGQQQ